jgi:hypothetical protein
MTIDDTIFGLSLMLAAKAATRLHIL